MKSLATANEITITKTNGHTVFPSTVTTALSLLDNSLMCKNLLLDSLFFDKLIALTTRPAKDGSTITK